MVSGKCCFFPRERRKKGTNSVAHLHPLICLFIICNLVKLEYYTIILLHIFVYVIISNCCILCNHFKLLHISVFHGTKVPKCLPNENPIHHEPKYNSLQPSDLIQHTVYLVLILHLQHLGCLVVVDTVPVQKETKRRHLHPLSLGISLENFSHFGGLLDLEECLLTGLTLRTSHNVSPCFGKEEQYFHKHIDELNPVQHDRLIARPFSTGIAFGLPGP